MITYEESRVRRYENFFREIVNSIIGKIDFENLEKRNLSFLHKTKERFRFDNENGWKFLCSCLDTIGDSQFAIVTFLNLINSNDDCGKKYLQIYGVLSAIYIQQQSIIKLSELFKIGSQQELKDELNNLEISFLRHSISAHPINYALNGQKSSYRVVRHSISNFQTISIINENNDIINYDLVGAIDKYLHFIETKLIIITKKMIQNSYPSADAKVAELNKKLDLIESINDNIFN